MVFARKNYELQPVFRTHPSSHLILSSLILEKTPKIADLSNTFLLPKLACHLLKSGPGKTFGKNSTFHPFCGIFD